MPTFSKPDSCNSCSYRSKSLGHLSELEIDGLQEKCIIVKFKKGESICKQGAQVSHALYLAKGRAKVLLKGKNNIIIKIIEAGNYIGLQSLFSDNKYRFSVEAVEDTTVCMIASDYFVKLSSTNHDFLFDITKIISSSTNCFYDKVNDINQKQLRGRLADSLLYLANTIYNSNEFELTITKKELGELSAMSSENAVRLLSAFKKEGIIEISGKKIKILHTDILNKLSEIG